jgi:hypothetical protein
LALDSSAHAVSNAIGSLINCGPVRVTRHDHSAAPTRGESSIGFDDTGVAASQDLALEWRVTFIGRLERRNLPLMSASINAPGAESGVAIGVFELQAGRGFSGRGLSPTTNAKDTIYDPAVEPIGGARNR